MSLYLEREKINTATSSVAILCDTEISATKLAAELQLPGLLTYTAGVERFSDYNSTKYSSEGGDQDTSSVGAWLERGGVLLTHSMQFRGCEADVVILVDRLWGYTSDGRRSGITRGVASLCLITPDKFANVDKMKKVYDLIHYDM